MSRGTELVKKICPVILNAFSKLASQKTATNTAIKQNKIKTSVTFKSPHIARVYLSKHYETPGFNLNL